MAVLMKLVVGSLCLLLLLLHSFASREIDISWDFNNPNDRYASGWANASMEVNQIEKKVENGELRCSIVGFAPKLDSPFLFLNVTNRHFVILRARYQGLATQGRLLMRSGTRISVDDNQMGGSAYWNDRQAALSIADSGAASEAFSGSKVVDNDPYSYFLSTSATVASITFDLQSFRWITGIRILPMGDGRSPKRCILLRSTSSGAGPFEKVLSFTMHRNDSVSEDDFRQGVIATQEFTGFQAYSRYWKLVVVDNHGGSAIAVREVYLDGYDERVTVVPFTLDNSGSYHMYYLPISTYLSGTLLRMRFEFLYIDSKEANPRKAGQVFRESFAMDYVRIARAPLIWKVRGCLDKYYESSNYQDPQYDTTVYVNMINKHLPLTYYVKNNMTNQFATTYDCPLEGGRTISIEGTNFGDHPLVYVDSRPCPVESMHYSAVEGRVQQILCALPSGLSSGVKRVRIENGVHPGLFYEMAGLAYRTAPPVPLRPSITNIAATKVDLVWTPPGDDFDKATISGYKILWFQAKYPTLVSNLTVGNITSTSVRGLEPGTEYVFAVAAVAEGQENANLPTDLYGRRDLVPGALVGEFSTLTNATGTLQFDFDFQFFNSNQTLNSSGSTPFHSTGPTGQYGSEGNYGLVIVGSANIQNCNVSSTCCDGYNASIGISSCGNYRSVCAVLSAYMLAYDHVLDGVTRRGVPSNLPYSNGRPADISISTLDELIANKGADLPSSACGPALRLTASQARSSGAVWYRRKMNVREGFDTYIKFEISNPSQKCDRLDDVNTYCRSRGADGLAFVIQNVGPDSLGKAGSGLGYEGIDNALAIELDTYHNYDQMDYYENHISVMTQGFRYNITANHSGSLATTNRIPDLTDGIHTVRIKYDPNFDPNAVPHPSFQVTGHTTWFLNNADFANGGEGDWGTGFGLLYVYLDDMFSPVITTPINLGATLELDDGRSYIGLTAATGDQYWQAHDILSWQFTSLYIDEDYQPPLIVNKEGAHTCVNESVCVHPVDYEHFTRKNNIWGKGSDNTEGWMTGKDGFCSTC